MKATELAELKEDTFYLCQDLLQVKGLEELSQKQFKDRMRQYGSLRKHETWKSAFADIKAHFLIETALDDGQFLLEEFLYNSSEREGWAPLRDRVIARLMEHPKASRAIAYGFLSVFKLYGCDYGATTEAIASMFTPDQWAFLNLYSQALQPVRVTVL